MNPPLPPDEMMVDWYNMAHGFDSTNLHLHGFDMEVHMFDLVSMHDPNVLQIVVEPCNCYCYQFCVVECKAHWHQQTALALWESWQSETGVPNLHRLLNTAANMCHWHSSATKIPFSLFAKTFHVFEFLLGWDSQLHSHGSVGNATAASTTAAARRLK